MKIGIAFLAASAVVISASADLTQFAWSGGTLADQVGGIIPYGQATVFTILDADATPDILSLVAFGGINAVDLDSFVAYSTNPTVGPPFAQEQLNTGNIDGDGSIAGMYAYAIVARGVYGSINEIQLGDYFGITSVAHLILDLQPDPGQPPATKQTFNPGNVQTNLVVGIPEPATIGLMGIAGVAMFLARRKTHR